jgi:O-antigen/teichoic acid export membrane protein
MVPGVNRPPLRRAISGLAFPGLLRSSGWVLFGAGVSRGATLLASVLVARLIVPDEFGRLTLTLSAVTLLAGFAGLGLTLALTRQVAEAKTTQPRVAGRYIGSVILLTAAVGLAMAVAIALGRAPIAQTLLQSRAFGSLIAAAAAAVLFTTLNSTIQGALTGLEAFRQLAAAQWIQGLGTAAGLIVGASAGGALGAMVGFSIGQCGAAGCSLELLRRNASAQGVAVAYAARREEVGHLFRYGIPAFVALITVSCAIFGGQFLLSRQPSGYAAVALFSVAYRWQLVILFVPACIAPVLVPVMTRLHVADRGRELASIFRGTMWGTFALAGATAAVIAAAAPVVLGFSGEFYSRHPLPLMILAAASIPAALNNVLSSTSVSLGAMREWLLSDVVLAIALLGTAAALVGSLGATGLAVAYLAGMVATDLVLAWPLSRRLRTSTLAA